MSLNAFMVTSCFNFMDCYNMTKSGKVKNLHLNTEITVYKRGKILYNNYLQEVFIRS